MRARHLLRRAEPLLPRALVRPLYLRHLNLDPREIEGVTFRLASTMAEREGAFRLVHDSYVRKGLLDRSPTGMHVPVHALLATTTVFVAVRDETVIGTMSLVEDGPLGLPSDDVFPRELGRVRARAGRLAELSAFAIAPHVRGRGVSLMLYNLMFRWVWLHRRTQDIVIAVHPRVARFYEVVLLFDRMHARAPYHRLKEAEAEALHLDLRGIERRYERLYKGKHWSDGAHAVNLYDFFGFTEYPQLILPPAPLQPERTLPPAWLAEDLTRIVSEHRALLAQIEVTRLAALLAECPALRSVLGTSSSIGAASRAAVPRSESAIASAPSLAGARSPRAP